MKTITHVITTIERGGAENQLLILCREQRRKGLQVQLFYLQGLPTLESDFRRLGVSVRKLSGSFIKKLYQLKTQLKYSDTDIVHAHLPKSELMASLAKGNLPLVISRHNAEAFFPKAPRFLSKGLSRFVIRRSNGRIAISHHVKEFIQKSGESLPEFHFSTIYYGYEFNHVGHRKRIPAERPLSLITIGRLVPQKDYVTLLTALSLLVNLNIEFKLMVLGEGPMDRELKNLAKKLGVADSIDWLGKVDDVFEFLLSADIFILSSVYEGFGLVILEAIEAEIPIVCTDIPTSKEILGPNYEGFFQVKNPESLVRGIIYAQRHGNELVSYSKSRMDTFNAQRMANEILLLYKDVTLAWGGLNDHVNEV